MVDPEEQRCAADDEQNADDTGEPDAVTDADKLKRCLRRKREKPKDDAVVGDNRAKTR